MKPFIVISLLISLAACNTKSTYVRKPMDSTWTSIIYCNDANLNDYRITTAHRFTKDSSMIDTVTNTVKLYRDTSYIIPLPEYLYDSMHHIMKDSLGRPKQKISWYLLRREFLLQDYNKNWRF